MNVQGSSPIQDVTAILQMAQEAQLNQAKKLMEVAVEARVMSASAAGVGGNVDAVA